MKLINRNKVLQAFAYYISGMDTKDIAKKMRISLTRVYYYMRCHPDYTNKRFLLQPMSEIPDPNAVSLDLLERLLMKSEMETNMLRKVYKIKLEGQLNKVNESIKLDETNHTIIDSFKNKPVIIESSSSNNRVI